MHFQLASAASVASAKENVILVSGGEITEETLADGSYPETVVDTLVVTANQSWSATVTYADPDNKDWITLSDYEHINLSGAKDDVPVVITFLRNKGTSDREATLTITSHDCTKVVPFSQKGVVYKLPAPEVTTPAGDVKDLQEIYPIEDTCLVKITCNTLWKAEILSSTTADVKLSATSGEDDSEIYVYFGENTDQTNAKTAAVQISAEGCEPQVINFTQAKGFPYISVPVSYDRTRLPYERSFTIPIRTNTEWTAEIDEEGTNLSGAKLSATSGTKSNTSVTLSYSHGRNPGVMGKATIHFKTTPNAEGQHLDCDLVINQEGSLHLDFNDWKSNASNPAQPYSSQLAREFTYPSKTVSNNAAGQKSDVGCTSSTNYPSWPNTRRLFKTIAVDGVVYEIPVFGSKGFWMNSTRQCFLIAATGSTTAAYIAAPALEGLTLKKVMYEPSMCESGYNVRIVEADDKMATVVKGGEDWKSTVGYNGYVPTAEYTDVHTFTLEGTEPNTEYRLRNGASASTIYVKEVLFIYE